MKDTYELLKEAIEQKLQVTAIYKDCQRSMCPHVLGIKNGKYKVLFYHFDGDVSQGELSEDGAWKCMFVDKLSHVELHDGAWYTGKSHKRKQTCVDFADVIVDYQQDEMM